MTKSNERICEVFCFVWNLLHLSLVMNLHERMFDITVFAKIEIL